MRQLVLILLAAVGVNLMSLAPASAETVWTTWGQAPYASSQEEAMERLPAALQALGIPEAARTALAAEVARNPQGERIYLNPGDRLTAMMSGGRAPHAMQDVVVGRNPVRRGVVLAAEARQWRVTVDGQEYFLILPDICYNWSWRSSPRQQEARVQEPECFELQLPHVRAGDRVTLRIRDNGRPLPSAAALCRTYGPTGVESAWPTCFECFRADGPMVIRVAPAVAQNYEVEICWEHDGRPSLRGVVPPNAWRNRRFEVPDLMTIAPISRGSR